ncbi:hypothetical protein BIW11_13018 [Tropilaelaps mercedesae]|uniref:LIM zinc-binding domain-containing protein n=1 Tax=Tropilaelaps mercedesae TaxID=418985 RepID=A0A1V9X3Q5_9ACAR|nr:hypothetical protein BIW11_13018 [Tropilaelaps mercedesae]
MLLTFLHLVDWLLRSLSPAKGKSVETDLPTAPSTSAEAIHSLADVSLSEGVSKVSKLSTPEPGRPPANAGAAGDAVQFPRGSAPLSSNSSLAPLEESSSSRPEHIPSSSANVTFLPRQIPSTSPVHDSLAQKQSYVQNAIANGTIHGLGSRSLAPERTLRSRENIPPISIERLKNAYNSLAQIRHCRSPADGAILHKSTSCPDDLVPVNISALRAQYLSLTRRDSMSESRFGPRGGDPAESELPKATLRRTLSGPSRIRHLRESLTRQPSIHAAREASPVEDVKLSVDKRKVQSQFSVDSGDVDGKCKRCQTTVYPAECVRAEKAQYHKKCFTCKECKKSLSAESYHSHESELYCANHFKQLFQPKVNFDQTAPLSKFDF